MKYMGSKRRIAKHILPIILADRKPEQYYVEPFCGGCNILDKVENPRIGNDSHRYLIGMFRAMQHGWQPPDSVSELSYFDIRTDKDSYPDELVGFVGFGCSFSGKWFGGYARGDTNNGSPRNYCLESKKNVLKQIENLQGVEFYNLPYQILVIPDNSIVYCDPPYEGTTKYKDDFDHEKYWNWVRELVKQEHKVFCSEYNAPNDFICVWQKEIVSSLDLNTGSKKGIEKLFVHESQYSEEKYG